MEKFRSLAGKRALQTKLQSGQQATSNQGASAQGGQLKQIGQTKIMWDHCFDFQRKDGCKRANCDKKHVFVECERFRNSACRFNENTCRFKH